MFCLIFPHFAGDVIYLPNDASIAITLKSREFEVFTVVPLRELSNGVKFAPIGLIKMFNSGGAIKDLNYKESNGTAKVIMKVRGCGLFGAYSSDRPKIVTVDSEKVEFRYVKACGLIIMELRIPEKELYEWNISIHF